MENLEEQIQELENKIQELEEYAMNPKNKENKDEYRLNMTLLIACIEHQNRLKNGQ